MGLLGFLRRNPSTPGVPNTKSRGKHHVVPWIDDPMKGATKGHQMVFHQRHEADTIELFFDLFFVANLATFTAYHAIIDIGSLAAYIGFFAFIWSTWFQVTLYDVRFARDSIFERACKVLHMIMFVAFALVGSKFQPNKSESGSNTNYRVLCYTLGASRFLLAIQYTMVLVYAQKAKAKQLTVPLLTSVITFVMAGIAFFLLVLGFFDKTNAANRPIFVVWWVIMILEALVIIAVSCTWRSLSFKATHLVERMGLLTLIVIGEGAIGVTKTVSKIMGKNGPDVQGSFLICCIVLVLFFLWMFYFDNQPKQHYGTIRQQLWSALHFPLHIAIVLVVEGSQQLVQAHYVFKAWTKFLDKVSDACVGKELDGEKLTDYLTAIIAPYALADKPETLAQSAVILQDIYSLGNATGVCSPDGIAEQTNATGFPDYYTLVFDFLGALYQSNGAKLPKGKDPMDIAFSAYGTVYIYFWLSFAVVLLCSMAFLQLVRKQRKADLFDYASMGIRAVCCLISLVLFGIGFSDSNLTSANLIFGPYIVPTIVFMLFAILGVDQLSRIYCNRQLKQMGLYPEDDAAHHDHGHGHGHGHDDHGHEGEKKHSAILSVESESSHSV